MLAALLIPVIVISFSYFFLILSYTRSFLKASDFLPSELSPEIRLSLVIPFKNEEDKLTFLFEKLNSQCRNNSKVDILLINDHSEDKSFSLAESFVNDNENCLLYSLPDGLTGKKEALRYAVTRSKNDYVLFTDADTFPGPRWIHTVMQFVQLNKPVFVSAPVRMIPYKDSFFHFFQALDFASLTGAGLASFIQRSPIMCNAANMVVRKDVFLESYKAIHPELPTGDDMFILQYVKKNYPDQMTFMKSMDAIVNTCTEQDWKSFIHQRSRWASKAVFYTDPMMIIVALLVFGLSIIILILSIAVFFNTSFLYILTAVLFLKAVADYTFFKVVLDFYQQKKLLKIFFPAFIIYPFYIFAASLQGFVFLLNKYRKTQVD